MKTIIGCLLALSAGGILAILNAGDPPAPEPARQSTTFHHRELTIDTSGKKVRVRGTFRLERPDVAAEGHAIIVRLTVAEPGDLAEPDKPGRERHSEDIAKADFRRGQSKTVVIPIPAREWAIDAAGLDIKVAAIDLGQNPEREIASVVVHGTPGNPSPGPR